MNINRANNAPAFKALIRIEGTNEEINFIVQNVKESAEKENFKFGLFDDEKASGINGKLIKKIATNNDAVILSNLKDNTPISEALMKKRTRFAITIEAKKLIDIIKEGRFYFEDLEIYDKAKYVEAKLREVRTSKHLNEIKNFIHSRAKRVVK